MMNEKLPGLFNCKSRILTPDEAKTLLQLLFLEMKNPKALVDMDKTLRDKNMFQYQVLAKRLEVFKQHFSPTLDIGIGVQVFCSSLCSLPGMAVMWAYTLNELFVKLGHKVSFQDWVTEFPDGVPTEEEYQRIWDLQKIIPVPGSPDNLVDDFRQWSVPNQKGEG